MVLPLLLNPATINAIGVTISTLIGTGKMLANEIEPFLRRIFRRTLPGLTEEQLQEILFEMKGTWYFRLVLSRAEAGLPPLTAEELEELFDIEMPTNPIVEPPVVTPHNED